MGMNVNMQCNQPQPIKTMNKPEAMEIDNSNKFRQSTNWQKNQQMNGPQKREYNSSRQQSPQQPNKFQRIKLRLRRKHLWRNP